MELVLFIATILNLISVCINIYSYRHYTKLTDEIINDIAYPPYYHDVWIHYCLPEETTEIVEKAWLSVNDNGEYIWTKSENEQIIPDEWVVRWKYIK